MFKKYYPISTTQAIPVLCYQHTAKNFGKFGRFITFMEHLKTRQGGREKSVTKIPLIFFLLLQKVEHCCNHCYKQQLNMSYYFSMLRLAGLQNNWGMDYTTWSLPLGENFGYWKWLFADSTLAEHNSIVVQTRFCKILSYHFIIWDSHCPKSAETGKEIKKRPSKSSDNFNLWANCWKSLLYISCLFNSGISSLKISEILYTTQISLWL